MVSGGFIWQIAEVFSGSARILFSSMMCPRNFSSVRKHWHLFGLRVAPADSIRLRTALSRAHLGLCQKLGHRPFDTQSLLGH